MAVHIQLSLARGEYTIHRFDADHLVPDTARGEFLSVVRTAQELSVICESTAVLASERSDAGWRLIAFEGPFAFTQTGILASVLAPLAAAEIGILALSTFDTDYVLVKAHDLALAVRVLNAAGHAVRIPLD